MLVNAYIDLACINEVLGKGCSFWRWQVAQQEVLHSVAGQVLQCDASRALLDTKILFRSTRIVAGSEDEASICLTPMPVANDCRNSWR